MIAQNETNVLSRAYARAGCIARVSARGTVLKLIAIVKFLTRVYYFFRRAAPSAARAGLVVKSRARPEGAETGARFQWCH